MCCTWISVVWNTVTCMCTHGCVCVCVWQRWFVEQWVSAGIKQMNVRAGAPCYHFGKADRLFQIDSILRRCHFNLHNRVKSCIAVPVPDIQHILCNVNALILICTVSMRPMHSYKLTKFDIKLIQCEWGILCDARFEWIMLRYSLFIKCRGTN